jgi:predicted acyltransferase
MSATTPTPAPVSGPVEPLIANPVRRLLSLDALRGLTIAFMIMVNNNGSDHAWSFMKHADWNGMTATDLVFPTFLFVVGVSIVFAFEANLAKGVSRAKLAAQTVKRAIILFLFGVIVNTFPFTHLEHIRIYGVLQRIAICYLIAGLLYLWDRRWQSKVVIIVACLVFYWILMRWIPVPGYGMPGRDIPFLDKDAQWVAYVDRNLHLGSLYEGTRDPEGLLSDIPALGTALLGVLTGIWLRTTNSLTTKAKGLAAGALTLLILGFTWSIWFPLNKKLWTSSYVLAAAGISLSVLTLFFWIIEVKNWRGGWTYPLLVFGSNSILAYMFSETIGSFVGLFPFNDNGHRTNLFGWAWTHGFNHIPDPGWASFAFAFSYMVLSFIPVWICYRKKIFLKV